MSYVLLGCRCPDGFTLLDFEDLPGTNPITDQNSVPSNYSDFTWTNFKALVPSIVYPNSGFMTVVAIGSGRFAVYNDLGRTASIASRPQRRFHVKSFLATGAWNNNLRLLITGSRLGFIVHTTNVILQATSASIINLDWPNIDRINLTSSGGSSAGFPHYSGVHFAMDDLCIKSQENEIDIGK